MADITTRTLDEMRSILDRKLGFTDEDGAWLIAEVERLRELLIRLQETEQLNLYWQAEIEKALA